MITRLSIFWQNVTSVTLISHRGQFCAPSRNLFIPNVITGVSFHHYRSCTGDKYVLMLNQYLLLAASTTWLSCSPSTLSISKVLLQRKSSRAGRKWLPDGLSVVCLSVDLKPHHQHAATGKELTLRGDKIKSLKGRRYWTKTIIYIMINTTFSCNPLNWQVTRLTSREKCHMWRWSVAFVHVNDTHTHTFVWRAEIEKINVAFGETIRY